METVSYGDLIQRHDSLDAQIAVIKDFRTHRDLLKMARSCDNYRADISRELVECRRLKHETVKYQELIKRYADSIGTLEEYVTFAVLLDR